MKEINEKDLERTAGGAQIFDKKLDGAASNVGEDIGITGNKCSKYEPNSESLKYLPPVLLKCSNCIHYKKINDETGSCELNIK